MSRCARWILIGVLASSLLAAGSSASPSNVLTLEDRVAAQRAVEEIRWAHRLWPASNTRPKPPLAEVLSDQALRDRAVEGLKKSTAFERFWGVRVTGEMIQAEIDRMVRSSRSPQVLKELFAALGNDSLRIAEILARPIVADRMLRDRYEQDGRLSRPSGNQARGGRDRRPFDEWWSEVAPDLPVQPGPAFGYVLPDSPVGNCVDDTWAATSVDLPYGRTDHTSVWTGSEMIVWGGLLADESYRGLGARYDPALDTWTPVRDDATAPAGRYRHAAVWTGTEMMIWGGGNLSTTYNTGGLYNPLNDSWRSTTVDANTPVGVEYPTGVWTGSEVIVYGGPSGGGRYNPVTGTWIRIRFDLASRTDHTAVWTGTEMIVWGGFLGGTPTNSGWRFNPATGIWTATPVIAGTPAARFFHTAVLSGGEMIVWGGENSASASVNSGGRFNLNAGTWTPTRLDASTPAARYRHTAVWTGDRMIVWGGEGPTTSTGGVYRPATDTWTATRNDGTAPDPSWSHTAVWTGSEMIVFGGEPDRSNVGERYDPATDTWKAAAVQTKVPVARFDHTAVWTGSEMIVWGGRDETVNSSYLQSGGRYDPATDSWTDTRLDATTPSPRSQHTAVWTGTEMIVWGGIFGAATAGGGRYNPAADTWTAVRADASAPVPRAQHTAVWTGREMIVWGGNDPTNSACNTGGRYDPGTDSWTLMPFTGTQPWCRAYHTAVWTGREMIVWGGYGPTFGYLDTGGRYDPVANSWTPTSTGPAARRYHLAVWTGREMIVWGGQGTTGNINSGSRYNPATNSWTPTRLDASTPSAGRSYRAVWSGHEMLVWAYYGGRYDPLTDTWRATRADATTPASGASFSSVWDGNEMIVWGGEFGGGNAGGRYCACPGPATLYYQDADGDGHGDANMPIASCSRPDGFADQPGDCSDSDPGSWAIPGETPGLGVAQDGTLSWAVPPDPGGAIASTTYDLLSSGSAQDFVSGATCVVARSPGLAAADPGSPPIGQVFYYLVRARNGCKGLGTLGTDSNGIERTGRDCP